jgi:hypothetical protein
MERLQGGGGDREGEASAEGELQRPGGLQQQEGEVRLINLGVTIQRQTWVNCSRLQPYGHMRMY